VKNEKLKEGDHYFQHSGDVVILAWQDKKATYQRDEMCVVINEVNQEDRKPVVLCDYSLNILGLDLKDQMLQPYLLKRKKVAKWYLKLFKTLLIVAVQNPVVM
jgi:hypothetical protein